jgi:hypothetical protein
MEIVKFLGKNKTIWALHPGHEWPGFTAQEIKIRSHAYCLIFVSVFLCVLGVFKFIY